MLESAHGIRRAQARLIWFIAVDSLSRTHASVQSPDPVFIPLASRPYNLLLLSIHALFLLVLRYVIDT